MNSRETAPLVQVGAMHEVAEGVLMDHQDHVINIRQSRVIIETFNAPIPPSKWREADKVGTAFLKWFLCFAAIYLFIEIVHAFSSGAVSRAVNQ